MSRTNASQAGAVAARTLLALFVVFGLVVFFLPTAPLGSRQAGAQASPSGTGPVIQFINPSGATTESSTSGPGREVSNSDGNGYHLVAWVGRMPANATADFKWTNPDGTGETTIGTGTLQGSDTFDIFWNALPPTDGPYKVKVILYSNGIQVATDTEDVVVNNRDADKSTPGNIPTGENTGQALEITYPTQAGPWGAFRKPGTSDPYVGVVDVNKSAGTTAVRAYYTTSPPGNTPEWVRCSTTGGENAVNSNDGVRCTLATGVNPASVTAIAAASGDADQTAAAQTCAPAGPGLPDENCGEGEDSGDAHRTTGYVQTPTSISLNPATQRVDDDPNVTDSQFPCSAPITATLLDQFSRKVAGANVDVHAAGPTDNLYFDDPDGPNPPAAYQPPNANNHTTEGTVNCEDAARPLNTSSGQGQGEHEVQGEGDIKHIETVPAGTNDAGQLTFRLHNRTTSTSTVTGVTQITAYFDRNDDDAMCSAEPQGDASIGWGADPGTPTGTADENTTCPEPTPTGTATASPTASSSSTASPSRSATGSPTSSATPGTARTITLTASRAKAAFNQPVTFSGQIFSSDSTCRDGEFVRILRRVHGTNIFNEFATTTTTADGSFDHTANLTANADYRAVTAAHDNCQATESDLVSVLVKAKVSAAANDSTPRAGSTVVFTGKVTPNHKGTNAVLQRKKGSRWVKVAADELNRRSRYRFAVEATWPVRRVFRVKWKSQDSDHETGVSRTLRITIS